MNQTPHPKKENTPQSAGVNHIKRLAALVAGLVFPRRCPWCNRVVGFAPCCGCEEQVKAATRLHAFISHHGRALGHVNTAFAPFLYRSPVKDAVWAMKFQGQMYRVAWYAGQMAQTLEQCGSTRYDMIVPVPSTKAEHRGRDNLPFALACAVGRALDLPVQPQVLQKIKETKRQMTLSGVQRRKNVTDAFSVAFPQRVAGCNVLLVDDILTTGSTLNECAKALRAAGAVCCDAVCIALSAE